MRNVLVARDASESAIEIGRQAARLATDGDLAGAQASLPDIIADLERAQAALATAPVSIAAHLPLVGTDVRVLRAAVAAARELAGAGEDLVGFLEADRPPIFTNARFDSGALAQLAGALDDARTHVGAARSLLADAPRPYRSELKDKLARLDDVSERLYVGLTGSVAVAARLQESGTEPLRVLILFENGAELRGTGGFMGFFAVLEVDDGAVDLARTGPISDLRSVASAGQLTSVPAPAEYVNRYGNYLANTALWSNVNLSPHFPWVAQVAGDLYTAATGEHADLVVRVDLTGLGEILAAMPPEALVAAQFDPTRLATDVVLDSYLRFPQPEDQNAYLASLVGGVVATVLTSPNLAAGPLVEALDHAAQERRLAVFSDDPQIEQLFTVLGADGSLQPGAPGQVDVIVQNFGANKLDLFSRIAIDVVMEPMGCVMLGTVSTTVTNFAPPEAEALPVGNLGLVGRWWVNDYLPKNATVTQILVGGEVARGSIETELGRPVAAKIVEVAPGQSATVTVRWQEPLNGSPYRLALQPQPMGNPATLTVSGANEQVFSTPATFGIPTSCQG